MKNRWRREERRGKERKMGKEGKREERREKRREERMVEVFLGHIFPLRGQEGCTRRDVPGGMYQGGCTRRDVPGGMYPAAQWVVSDPSPRLFHVV